MAYDLFSVFKYTLSWFEIKFIFVMVDRVGSAPMTITFSEAGPEPDDPETLPSPVPV